MVWFKGVQRIATFKRREFDGLANGVGGDEGVAAASCGGKSAPAWEKLA